MKKLLSIILGLFFSNLLFSQVGSVEGQDINLPKITSPSPDVYNFKEYGEIPVSYYTGIPQISVPIYQITTKSGLSIPISLDYHAGGIRVDEMAGTVGLGWSLKTGGAMSINVNGTPDYNGGNNFPSSTITSEIQVNGGYVDPMYDNGEPIYQYMRDIYDGNMQCKPDTYQFSIPSGSGEFYVDSNGNSHLMPAANYDVDFSNLEITDGGGNTTKFGFGDTTSKDPSGCKYTSLDDPLNSSTRSYNIDYIDTYLNENINYSYRNITYSYVASKVETDYEVVKQATTGCSYISDTNCENLIDVHQKLLTQIDFPGGNITFKYSDEVGYAINGNSDRLDLPGGVALRKIIIENSSGSIISEFEFNYDYFKVIGGSSSDNYRLKLLNVIKNDEEIHSFDYYEDQNLPKRLSFAQDFWGFYNGQLGNSTLIPEMIYDGQTLPGGNRTIGSLAYVRANSLKKITYPTKGSSTFIYEQNDYYSQNETTTNIINEGFGLGSNEFTGLLGSKTVSQSQDGEILDFKINIYNQCGNDDNNGGLSTSTNCIVNLKDANGDLYANYTETGTYIIDPGGYDFSQITLEMQVDDCSCVAEVSWNRAVSTTSPQNIKAAGLRIGQIINEPVTGNSITRNYSYLVPGTTQSSGKFHDYPQFYSSLTTPGKPGSEGYPTTETCEYLIRQNSPFYTLNTASGQSVGYQHVQESISGNGETHYKFSTYNDLALSLSLPVVPVTSYAWKRGLLLKKEVISESGVLLKKTENIYEFDNQFASNSNEYQGGDYLSIGVSVSLSGLRRMSSYVVLPILKYNINYFPTSWIKNVEIADWSYENGQFVKTVTNKGFSDLDNLLPTFTSMNDGVNVNEVYTTYPYGVTTTSLGYEALTSTEVSDIAQLKIARRNTLPVQIETKTKNSSGTVVASSVRRNLYKDFNGYINLSEIKSSKEGSTLEERLRYHRYDNSGNPVDVSKTEGSHVIYLWGYNDQFPIAKIENSTYADVASALGKTVATLDTEIDESDMNVINNLRSNPIMSGAFITTYTYEPLIGITSIRDPRGYDTYYHYDGAGRLEVIKDDLNKLLKDFEYNYQQ